MSQVQVRFADPTTVDAALAEALWDAVFPRALERFPSTAALAAATECSRSHISSMKTRARRPSVPIALCMAAAAGLPLCIILDDEGVVTVTVGVPADMRGDR